jgi:hypothetical protein
MNKNRHFLFASAIVLALAALSCSDNEPESSGELSEFANEFISMRLGSPNNAMDGAKTAINQSFQSMMGNLRGSAAGRVRGDSTGDGDSTVYPEPWKTCATITTKNNSDGSVTTIYDYGDGCEEGWGNYKYYMHGRIEYTYRYVATNTGSTFRYEYLYRSKYDNYGGGYPGNDSSAWSMDGDSFYEGYSTYDTVSGKFSGAYSYDGESDYQYGGKQYEYKSKGKSTYDEKGWLVTQNDYEYEYEDHYYKSVVLEPLFTDYTCNEDNSGFGLTVAYFWVPVSGREKVNYKKDGKEGSFEIDYGDGECDNIIYVIENGNRVKVDLGSGWLMAGKEG